MHRIIKDEYAAIIYLNFKVNLYFWLDILP
jgi:hypothetical protein